MGESTGTQLPRTMAIMLTAAAAVIVVLGMKTAAGFLSTFLLAFVIAIALAPLPHRIEKRGLPLWLGFIITVLFAVLVLVFLGLVLTGALLSFEEAIPKYQDELDDLVDGIDPALRSLGVDPDTIDLEATVKSLDLASFAASFIGGVLNVLSNISVVLLLIFFMLLDALGFKERFELALEARPATRAGWTLFAVDTRKYLVITTWTGLLVGAVNTIFLLFLGVDFAFLWGVMAFLFSFIPNVGFILALIPPTMLALLEFGWEKALIVIVGYILINAMVDNVLKPRVIGSDLDLSYATTFVSLVFWGWVIGPLGAILAVPLTLLVKNVLLDPSDDAKWLSGLISLGAPDTEVDG